jgi:hypothetical protein
VLVLPLPLLVSNKRSILAYASRTNARIYHPVPAMQLNVPSAAPAPVGGAFAIDANSPIMVSIR